MKSEETKMEFALTFLNLAEKHPFEQISVSMVINASGKNRNTFYYHFRDKTSLVLWIYRDELGDRLKQAQDGVDLLFETGDQPFSSAPYYAREITGIRTVNNSFFVKTLFETLGARQEFYSQALSGSLRKEIERYLLNQFAMGITEDLNIILSGRHISDADRSLIVNYHAAGLLGLVESTLLLSSRSFTSYLDARFINLIPESISFEIENRRF